MAINKVIYDVSGEQIVDQSGSVTVYGINGTANKVNKVEYGTRTLIDITDTTADESHVLSGYVIHKADGTKVTGIASNTLVGDGGTVEDDTYIVGEGGGGSVTITDEVNAAGITCVITTSSTPSSDIPLNTQLIDYTTLITGRHIDGTDGSESVNEGACCTTYIDIDPSMTFSYVGYRWFDLAFYDSSKSYISGAMQNDYADTISNDYAHGTLTPARIPSNAEYIRLSSYPNVNITSTQLSLIRTA